MEKVSDHGTIWSQKIFTFPENFCDRRAGGCAGGRTDRQPLALSADKATYKHRSRQFLGGVTISPGGENFLETLRFGQPTVKEGSTATALVKNMEPSFDLLGVNGSQIESTVFDGVYFHIGVQEHFEAAFGLKEGNILYSYDTLHKSGLVDTHLCKKNKFAWVVSLTDVYQQLFKLFNWGANYEKLVAATTLWKLHLVSLVGFSETRFANSRRKVYTNIHHEFPAIMTCLETDIIKAITNPDSRAREKGDKAKELKGKILNVHFLLNLSGLADVYEQFGAIVNIAQMVHLLPHERYELYMDAVDMLGNMAECLSDHSKCSSVIGPRKKVGCLWPLNHADKTLIDKSEIRGIPVMSQYGTDAAGLQCQTRHQVSRQNQIARGIDAVKKSDAQLDLLVKEIFRGLRTEVYDEESVRVITLTKVIFDLPNLSLKLHQDEDGGYIKVSVKYQGCEGDSNPISDTHTQG